MLIRIHYQHESCYAIELVAILFLKNYFVQMILKLTTHPYSFLDSISGQTLTFYYPNGIHFHIHY